MNVLTPSQAASMAQGVYRVRAQSVSQLIKERDALGGDGSFEVTKETGILGTSGAILKKRTGFGYIAEGRGPFRGHLAVVMRGTDLNIWDWGSNLNVGMQIGPGGALVHAGFNEVWKSYRQTLDNYLRGRNPEHIHCVGHSLGGALAFLNADHFTSRKVAPVTVYTFGCPRVGSSWFAKEASDRIGSDSIFRAENPADPVPYLAPFPFYHAPLYGGGFRVGHQGQHAFISKKAHGLSGGYIPGVSGKSWADLQYAEMEVTDWEIERWLSVTSHGADVLPYSVHALQMIGRLLRWLLKKSGALTLGALGLVATGSVTLLDQLAGLLSEGLRLSADLMDAGMALARAVFRFLGYVAGTTYEMTVRFLRWLLELLLSRLAAVASSALGSEAA